MMKREMKSGVFWVGAVDWDRRLFDSLIPLPDGTSYNAYLLQGSQKTALLDAVDPSALGKLKAHLEGVERIDYIVAHHVEQDHSGGIPFVLEKYPESQVICTPKAKDMLIDHLGIEAGRIATIGDGEKLHLGDKTLRAIHVPWVHWPETMATYLEEDRILFSCDWFGSHLATSDLYVSDDARILEPAKRYYAEIMMPFRMIIQNNLDKIKDLPIEIIAPSHGPIYSRPEFIIQAYRDWVSETTRNEVVIPYVSMHGSTAALVERLASALIQRGVLVHLFNLSVTDVGKLAMSLVDATSIVIGSPTVHAGPHPVAAHAAFLANALRPKVRFASIIGSYGWGGRTVEVLKNTMSNLRVNFLPPVIAKGLPKESDFKVLDVLAETIAEKHKALGLN